MGKNRAECSHKSLAELNTYVPVHLHTDQLQYELLRQFQVVVLTDSSNDEQVGIGKFCHENGIKFIVTETRGVFG